MELYEILKNACLEMNLELSEFQIKQFETYKTFLIEYNKKVNLTSILDEKEIILKHFIDSLSPLQFINISNKTKIIDVGTGAGFPGIPLKIAKPELEITLLDSLNKRIEFLKELSTKLSLTNINCIHCRAEDLAQNDIHREKYDFSISRAVANLSTLLEYNLPFVKIGGSFIAMKGKEIESELLESKKSMNILGGEIEFVKTITLPFSDISHSIISVRKLKETPTLYPRKAGKPSKNPIK